MSSFNPVEIIKKLKGPFPTERARWEWFDKQGLTKYQQQFLLDQLQGVNKELGLDKVSIPDDPATFAQKFSLGTRVPWQRARHLDVLNDKLVEMSTGKCPRLIVAEPPRHGKLLSHKTLVSTQNRGWVAHGDLKVGDYVFHPSGKPIKVLALSKEYEANIKIRFYDGEEIVCHENHEWVVFDRAKTEWRTIETKELFKGINGRARFQLPLQEGSLIFNTVELPIDPYYFGVWLGDGYSSHSAICGTLEDLEEILKHINYTRGYRAIHKDTGVHYQGFKGVTKKLRLLGVLNNKHIPELYLFSDEQQRRELLAGLVDTDGSVDIAGRVRFRSSSELLVRHVAQLARSLNYRASIDYTPADTRERSIVGGPSWCVQWTPHDGKGAGKLLRKSVKRFRDRRRIGIASVEKCQPEPGRCIQVDSADGLYLVGETLKPTHNSEFCSFWYPLWVLAKNPKARIIIASYNHSFAESFGRRLRDFVRDRGAEIGLELDPATTAASRWFVKSGGSVQTVGRGGPLTGKGADCLIIDDPLKDSEEANSETIREKLWEWWQTTASTRLEPGGTCLVVQTRWHFQDLAGQLEKQQEPKWETLSLTAIAEVADPLGREVGEALWPERYPIEALNQIKNSLTIFNWSALYQQSPVPASGGLFQFDWWQYYKQLPDKFDIVIQSWDFSFKDLKKSDYTVGQVWGRKGASYYLIDQIRAQLNAKTSIDAIRAFTSKYPQARAKLFEDKANGPALKALLQQEVGGIIPINPKGSKAVRLEAVQPFVQAGNVYLPDQSIAPWVGEFVLEAAQFPLGAHDDMCDAFSQALNYLAPGGYLALSRMHSAASREDQIRHTNPQKELMDKFWAKMKKDTDKVNKSNDRAAKGKNTRVKLWQS